MKDIGATKAKRQKIKSHIPIFTNESELRTQERHLEEEKWSKIMYHDTHRQALIRKLEYIDPSKGKNGKKRRQFRAESMESMKNDKLNKKYDNRHWLLHYVDGTVAVTEKDFFVHTNYFNKITGRRISERTVKQCLKNQSILSC